MNEQIFEFEICILIFGTTDNLTEVKNGEIFYRLVKAVKCLFTSLQYSYYLQLRTSISGNMLILHQAECH